MGNHILFSLVFLNAVNFSSHWASTNVFFEVLAENTDRWSFERIFAAGRPNSEDRAPNENSPTLKNTAAAKENSEDPKLEGWDVVERADAVECKWSTDLDVGVPNQ